MRLLFIEISKIKEGIPIYIHKCCKGSIKVEKYKRCEFKKKKKKKKRISKCIIGIERIFLI